jgi:hypothetical protein
MKERQEINKKVAANISSIEADDIQQQIQKVADANGLQQKFSIFLESVPKSINDSVELKKTTKGVTWNIKCYGESAEAMQRANKLFDECEEKYGAIEDE